MIASQHSGSPSKMIAPLLLILVVMANTPHHVHGNPRGKVQNSHLRQEDNGGWPQKRQLRANPPPPEVPTPGLMGMGLGVPMQKTNIVKKDIGGKDNDGKYDIGKIKKTGRRKLANIFDNSEAAAGTVTTQQVTGTVDCTLPTSGFFGNATTDFAIVPYLYQVYVVNGTPLTIIKNRIAPILDRGFVEGILPFFFPCAGGSTGRRHLQTAGRITGISTVGIDIPVVGGLACIGTQTTGDCLIFAGEMSVFVDGLTDAEAIEEVQSAIQAFIQSGGPQSLSPFVLDSAFVTEDLQTLAPAPTRAPTNAPVATNVDTFSPTTSPTTFSPTITFVSDTDFPTLTPSPTTGFPTTTPGFGGTTGQPTNAPIFGDGGGGQPTLFPPGGGLTFAPTPVGGQPSLTPAPVSPTVQTSTSASPTAAPNTAPLFPVDSANTRGPTAAPAGTPAPANADGGGGNQSRSSEEESGIDKIDWWAWVLIGLAAVAACLCGMTYLNGGGGGAKSGRPTPKRSSGPEAPDDDYQPPGVVDDYQPPDLGAFNIEPTQEPASFPPDMPEEEVDEFYDDEEGEEEEEYEEEEYAEDEYGAEGVPEFEEAEEYEGGEYGDEYEDEEEGEGDFEEESYYEEETQEGSAVNSFTDF